LSTFFKKGGQDLEKWIAGVVGKMHIHSITQTELAEKVGITRVFLNRVLNGKEKGSNMKERITAALDELIKEKEGK
jgi:DNA-binding Xre family transcriptional regulator